MTFMTNLTRQIVQIAIDPEHGEDEHTILFALCNDGTVWMHAPYTQAQPDEWARVKDIPQDAAALTTPPAAPAPPPDVARDRRALSAKDYLMYEHRRHARDYVRVRDEDARKLCDTMQWRINFNKPFELTCDIYDLHIGQYYNNATDETTNTTWKMDRGVTTELLAQNQTFDQVLAYILAAYW